MKKLSLLFAFIGFFVMTNVSAQSETCCGLPVGTCILCPVKKNCDAKAVKNCSPAEVASCKKAATNESCNKSASATAVSVKSVEKTGEKTCCGLPISCCSKTTGTATKTANTKMACNKSGEKACAKSTAAACSKAKVTSTNQLAEKMD